MAHYKKPKHVVVVSKKKRPAEVGSFFGHAVSFSFRKYDAGAPWATTDDGKPSVDSVFYVLRGFEGLTWGCVMQTSGGRTRGTNSHYIPINELSKNAVKRMSDIGIEEHELFSMRLQSTVRLFGTIEPKTGCFFVIWYDPAHAVCPSKFDH